MFVYFFALNAIARVIVVRLSLYTKNSKKNKKVLFISTWDIKPT